jgi:hypothetical protein
VSTQPAGALPLEASPPSEPGVDVDPEPEPEPLPVDDVLVALPLGLEDDAADSEACDVVPVADAVADDDGPPPVDVPQPAVARTEATAVAPRAA